MRDETNSILLRSFSLTSFLKYLISWFASIKCRWFNLQICWKCTCTVFRRYRCTLVEAHGLKTVWSDKTNNIFLSLLPEGTMKHKEKNPLSFLFRWIWSSRLKEQLLDKDLVWEKTLPKRKHFIPSKRVPSSCQISTYCTPRDKWHKTSAKHYQTNPFPSIKIELIFLSRFAYTITGTFKKDLCLSVHKSMTTEVMQIQRLGNNALLKPIL